MAGQFELKIREFAERAKENADKAVRQVALEVSSRVIVRSPVDTGRFRANWQLGVDSPLAGALLTTDKTGAETKSRIIAALPKDAAGHVIYVTNNLPYAMRLEYGFNGTDSLGRTYAQAPKGMVRLTLAEFSSIVDGAAKAVNP